MGMRRGMWATIAPAAVAVGADGASAQQQDYIDKDGIRYQVIQVPTQVPITEMRSQEQTTYTQKVTTENVQHQQVYHVPVTQYQVVSTLHNRWNPFAEPYWTHHYEPVTTWQQQVGTVQIPVNKVTMVPETKTVQQPVTTWKTVNNTTYRAIGATPTGPGANTMMAGTQPQSVGATATLQPVQSQPAARVASTNQLGGTAMQSDPPRYGSGNTNGGWTQQPAAAATPIPQTAAQPAPAPAPASGSRY